jgi:hypothetical protein
VLHAALTAGRTRGSPCSTPPAAFPTAAFLGDHAELFDLPRLGGTLSHLVKTSPLCAEDRLPVRPAAVDAAPPDGGGRCERPQAQL